MRQICHKLQLIVLKQQISLEKNCDIIAVLFAKIKIFVQFHKITTFLS